ncbi:MAG: leishmanolysin-related zinc metalloendopeptidase [Gemmatimonadaceae bacterium]
MRNLSLAGVILCTALGTACSDSSGPNVGVLSKVTIKSGAAQTALAGTPLPTPIVVTPSDAQGRMVPGEAATFTVTAGGGTIANTTGTANADGTITAPQWTLGKSAVPQQLQVTIGGVSTVINATVTTAYNVDLRFFGRAITTAEKALFTDAANRIRAAVTGKPPLDNGAGADPARDCGATGVTPLTSADIIYGVIIYASIDSIDGKDSVLAQSGPCYIRSSTDLRTAIGIMKFDSADINSLAGSGNLAEVILHEMLHVVGVGVYWDSTPGNLNLLINYGPNVSYIGAGGIVGCKAVGGGNTCATSVPVEGVRGGKGTIDSHWRESTFGNELMTGFLNQGTNPLSEMTIRSIADLGYTGVNPAAADKYPDANSNVVLNLRSSFRMDDVLAATPVRGLWEKSLPHRPLSLHGKSQARSLRSNE